jgi:acylphosphatase
VALHLLIRGRVQGVGFRWSMCEAALERCARGWVRNRRDGCVEAVIDGDEATVASMLRWARQGPRSARVDSVETRLPTAAEQTLAGEDFAALPDA